MMERISISIGGSIFLPDDSDVSFLKELATLLIEKSKKRKIGIVTGGGKTARYYIKLGRALGVNEAMLDMLGIDATRINARTMIAALGDECYPKPALDYEEAISALQSYNLVVMGGTTPGHTTDAVTVILGERMHADQIIIATAVNG
ncbi:MAG: UMP kinase, partial [Thermoplasmata archaeon]